MHDHQHDRRHAPQHDLQPDSMPERTSRREAMLASFYGLTLAWINAYICRDMFFGSTAHMGSMHGFWAALAARAGSSWFHPSWWPFWDMGMPFEFTYPPLVPAMAAGIGALRGVSSQVGFHSVTGLLYILGPCTLFLMAWRLTRSPGYSFLAALAYSLTSITQLLAPDAEFAFAKFWDARRLFVVSVWDDTPHLAALALLPLIILFLARSIATRRPVYYAGAAASIGLAALASAFGPVMTVMAAACLLFVLRRDRWRANLLLTAGIGAYGWAIAAPFLSPSLMLAIRQASAASDGEGWSLGSLTAVAIVILGWAILWRILRRRTPDWLTTDWRTRFFVLLAWLTTSIPLLQLALHRHFLPQPGRYRFEMELALCLAVTFSLKPWIERAPLSVRTGLLLVALALGAEQLAEHRRLEKKFTMPADVTSTVEYRAAVWAWKTYPTIRFFLPGSMAQWANTFTDIQQFTGESFSMATNQVQQRADTAIGFGAADVKEDVHLTLTWLKAYGVGAVAISGKDSQEYWKPFTHPEKFEGVLPALWNAGGVTIYRVPLREFTLAHIVPERALVRHQPKFPDDIAEVERYVAALDDASLPFTTFQWEGRNRIVIRTQAADGQALSVQVSYHPGWHAQAGGKSCPIARDGLGLMSLKPGCHGPCEVVLTYDGGWELRLCRWLSYAALAGLPGFLLLDRRRLARIAAAA